MADLFDRFTGAAGLLTAHTADSGDAWGPVGDDAISLDGTGYVYDNGNQGAWWSYLQYSSWVPASADYSVKVTLGSDGVSNQATGRE